MKNNLPMKKENGLVTFFKTWWHKIKSKKSKKSLNGDAGLMDKKEDILEEVHINEKTSIKDGIENKSLGYEKEKSNLVDTQTPEQKTVDAVRTKKQFVDLMIKKPELLDSLNVERLLILEEHYDELIDAEEKKIKKLASEN